MQVGARVKDHLHAITQSANQKAVYADLTLMPLAANIGRNPHLLRLTEEVLRGTDLKTDTVLLQRDMGRVIGYTELIPTTETDSVFYARQTKTSGFTRFVKNRQTSSTHFISMSLIKDVDGDYELRNVWLGEAFPALPGEAEATEDSKEFWSTHAVVFNGQPLIASTLTKDCPY